MAAERTPLRELIGGRWAVSWQGNLLLYFISVIFIMFTEPAFAEPQHWLEGIAVSSLAYLAAVLVLGLASVTVLRNRRRSPVPIALVMVVGGIAWMARSAVLKWYLQMQDLPSQAGLGQRLVFGFLLGAAMVTITAWATASFADFYERRRQLVDELVRQELTTNRLVTYVEAMRQGVIDQVQSRVDQTAQGVPLARAAGDASPIEGIKALDLVSQEAARELSRSLWRTARLSARLDPRVIVRTTAMTRPFASWVLVPIAVFAVLVLARSWPLEAVAVIVGTTIGYAFVISVIANKLAPRLSPGEAVTSYIVALALLLASGALDLVVMRPWADEIAGSSTFPLLTSLYLGLVYPLAGPLIGIGSAQRAALDHLRMSISQQEITNAALQREEERIRREIATSLHGSWSGNLTAVSMRLQQAIDDGDKQAANEALFEARRLIDIDIASAARRESADLDAILTTLATAWDGLVDITTSTSITGEIAPAMLATIEDVVTEGINNAVRHGDASRIDITVESAGSTISITVADNGNPTGPATPGLGTQMLDSVAPGAWSRTFDPRHDHPGTVLSVQLKAAATLN